MQQFDGVLNERIDPQLEDIVNRMFARCLIDRRYKQAVGVAFEARRLDILERVLSDAVSRVVVGTKVISCHTNCTVLFSLMWRRCCLTV